MAAVKPAGPEPTMTTSRMFRGDLRAVASDGFDGTTFLCFLAERLFFGRRGLFLHKRISAALVAVKIAGRRLTAQVAVNALRIDVKSAGCVIRVLVRFIRHISSEESILYQLRLRLSIRQISLPH